jgi:enediyne biosynthesis protein E4
VTTPRRRSSPIIGLAGIGLAVAVLSSGSEHAETAILRAAPRRAQDTAAAELRVQLRNVADAAGLRFTRPYSPARGKYFVDSAPGGLAVFDYNGDGRPDVFFTNGAETPSLEKTSPAYANRLFRNDGGMRFTDVTDAARVRGLGYTMGAAAADYDNDGRVDLFVAGVRQNQLLHNRGDGAFDDVTARAGIGSGEWSVAGSWFDYDNDSHLDLLVVNYVQWSVETNRSCGDAARGVSIFCHPKLFQSLPNRLYRNRGDGTFEDVSARAGVLARAGKGMSAAVADFDHDGRPDVFVTNDTVANFLFRNKGDGTFEETALVAGVSVPDSGRAVSAMGTDAQDYDNDGWEDIVLTALAGETFPLFHNESGRGAPGQPAAARKLFFIETTQPSGLARLSAKLSGWCSVFADIDNDGWKDIFTANSHVNDRIGEYQAIEWKQANSVFINDGRGRFRDATSSSGLGAASSVHRGCGIADFNGDGRLDVVVLVLGGAAELWQNDSAPHRRWLIVRLVGTKSNRDGIGARVTVGNQVRTMTSSVGYASSSHAGVHFGLGQGADTVRVEVQWPSGTRQLLEGVKTNQVVEIGEK